MSVRKAQSEIDSREFSEWIAFWNIEPWGDSRADVRSALICSTMANAWRGRGDPVAKPKDFMPFAREDEDPEASEGQTPDDMKNRIIAITRAMGGEIRKAKPECPQSPACS